MIADEIIRVILEEFRKSPTPESSREKVLKTAKATLLNHLKVDLLLQPYGTERRKYHNYDHLWDMLALGTGEPVFARDVDATLFVMAVLGHDTVYEYNSVPQENELRSAFRTVSACQIFRIPEAEAVGHAIWATAKHGEDVSEWASPLAKELLDRDLYYFSKEFESFREDSLKVVDEIFCSAGEACRPLPKDQILKNQKGFFQHMLSHRPTIYYRHGEWEARARQNLAKYIREVN